MACLWLKSRWKGRGENFVSWIICVTVGWMIMTIERVVESMRKETKWAFMTWWWWEFCKERHKIVKVVRNNVILWRLKSRIICFSWINWRWWRQIEISRSTYEFWRKGRWIFVKIGAAEKVKAPWFVIFYKDDVANAQKQEGERAGLFWKSISCLIYCRVAASSLSVSFLNFWYKMFIQYETPIYFTSLSYKTIYLMN